MSSNKKRKLDHKEAPHNRMNFDCPNHDCGKTFSTERGLSLHFAHNPHCAVVSFKLLQSRAMAKIAAKQHHLQNSQTTASYDCDPTYLSDNNPIDHDEYNILPDSIDDNQSTQDSQEPNETFGSVFTQQMVHQTELLKILDEANAPHFLYSKIIEWVKQVKSSKVDVMNLIATRAGIIKQLENFIPDIKQVRPFFKSLVW